MTILCAEDAQDVSIMINAMQSTLLIQSPACELSQLSHIPLCHHDKCVENRG